MMIIKTLLIINGIYDIICGFDLIYNFLPKLNILHTQLFINIDNITKRFLGYLLLLLGMMRLSLNYKLIFLSYIFEAYLFEYEIMHNKNGMNIAKVRFVSIISIIFALVILIHYIFRQCL